MLLKHFEIIFYSKKFLPGSKRKKIPPPMHQTFHAFLFKKKIPYNNSFSFREKFCNVRCLWKTQSTKLSRSCDSNYGPSLEVLSCSKAPSRNRLSPISCISFQNLFFKDFNQKTGNGIFLKWNGFITAHVRLQLITDRDNIVILLLLINQKPFLAFVLTMWRNSV